jgi:hypothetical protein
MASITAVGNIELSSQTFKSKLQRPLNKVSKAALVALKHLAAFFLFPTRYLGAKDWSLPGIVLKLPLHVFNKILGKDSSDLVSTGYHKTFERILSIKEAKNLLPVLLAALDSNSPEKYLHPLGLSFIKPKDLNIQDPELLTFDTCFLNPSTGAKITLVEKNSSEILVVFGAKHSAKRLFPDDISWQKKVKKKQDIAIAQNLLGLKPATHTKTLSQVKQLLSHPFFNGKKITLTGCCFGGSLAQYLGLKLQLETVCFNSLQLGPGLQKDLGDQALAKADHYVTNISVKTDFLNDNPIYNFANRVLSFIGIKTPGNFGKQYYIPYQGPKSSHTFIRGSMMQHLGLHGKTFPSDLPKDFFE